MPSDRRVRCRLCGRHESEVGPISWRGKCEECWKRRFHENIDDLHYHRGPWLLHWRRGMARSVGGVLIDDVLKHEE